MLAFPDKTYIHVTFVINSFLRYFAGVCPFVVEKMCCSTLFKLYVLTAGDL